MERPEEIREFLESVLAKSDLNELRKNAVISSKKLSEYSDQQVEFQNFDQKLESELELYGFSLIRAGLSLLENEGSSELIEQTFEYAAITFYTLTKSNNKDDIELNFMRIIAAASYHLAGYSASAYSLFSNLSREFKFSIGAKAIMYLIIRDLDKLRTLVNDRLNDQKYSDQNIVDTCTDDEGGIDPDAIVAEILNSTICSALAYFDFALQTGKEELVMKAREILVDSTQLAEDAKNVPLWWICRLCLYLIRDLWEHSLHKILPLHPPEGENETYTRLRELYISNLYSKRRSEIEVWPSQRSAIVRATDINDNLVISLPTSAGKTKVAEIATLTALAYDQKVLIITPLRALSAQTEKNFKSKFTLLGHKVSSLYGVKSNSEIELNTIEENDIVIATPEKVDFSLRDDPAFLDNFKLIVFDEGHMIGPSEREVKFEVLIQRLLKRAGAKERRIVCLSAVLPSGEELEDFTTWLRLDQPGDPICEKWRPTRQRFGTLIWNGEITNLSIDIDGEDLFIENFIPRVDRIKPDRSPRPNNKTQLTIFAAWKFINQGKNTLIYSPIASSLNTYAEEIVDLIKKQYINKLPVEKEAIESALKIGSEWLGKEHDFVKCLEYGVGIHYRALPDPYKRELENLISGSKLKLVIASPTLSQGLNLSSSILLIPNFMRNKKVVDRAEFANVIGRAGRAFVDVEGQIIHVMYEDFENGEINQGMIDWRNDRWNELVKFAQTKEIFSGLVKILIIIYEILKLDENFDIDQLWEYLVNSSKGWDFIAGLTFKDIKEKNFEELTKEISSDAPADLIDRIDVSILSLSESVENDLEDLQQNLETQLEGSLWNREIQKIDSNMAEICEKILYARANFLSSRTDKTQRLGFYKLGLGLSAGSYIDENFDVLCKLIDQADVSTTNGDTESLVNSLITLAKILFSVRTFKPWKSPENWGKILRKWILGKNVIDIGPEGMEFVEDALVYKLVWAIEAVDLKRGKDKELELYYKGGGAASLETGVPDFRMSLLIRAGFSSRLGAQEVIKQTSSNFQNLHQLRIWLQSEEIETLSRQENWPTPDSADLWNRFRVTSIKRENKILLKEDADKEINYQEKEIELERGFYRISNIEDETWLLTPDFQAVAPLMEPIQEIENSLFSGEISDDSNIAKVTRIGLREESYTWFEDLTGGDPF